MLHDIGAFAIPKRDGIAGDGGVFGRGMAVFESILSVSAYFPLLDADFGVLTMIKS